APGSASDFGADLGVTAHGSKSFFLRTTIRQRPILNSRERMVAPTISAVPAPQGKAGEKSALSNSRSDPIRLIRRNQRKVLRSASECSGPPDGRLRHEADSCRYAHDGLTLRLSEPPVDARRLRGEPDPFVWRPITSIDCERCAAGRDLEF